MEGPFIGYSNWIWCAVSYQLCNHMINSRTWTTHLRHWVEQVTNWVIENDIPVKISQTYSKSCPHLCSLCSFLWVRSLTASLTIYKRHMYSTPILSTWMHVSFHLFWGHDIDTTTEVEVTDDLVPGPRDGFIKFQTVHNYYHLTETQKEWLAKPLKTVWRPYSYRKHSNTLPKLLFLLLNHCPEKWFKRHKFSPSTRNEREYSQTVFIF